MIKWGFKRGKYNPCLYHHPGTNLICMVHGDDFMSVGNIHAAREFKQQLEARFEIKSQMIGPHDEVASACTGTCVEEKGLIKREGRVLNRIVRWTPDGWEVEPDQRHAERIAQEMGMKEAKPVSTPGDGVNKTK